MTTSEGFTVTTATGANQRRVALRLNLAGKTLGRGRFDGAWWPQSRNFEAEAAELIDNFPAAYGHIERVEYSAPHWGIPDREISAAQGNIRAEASRRDDAHIIVLTLSTGRTVRLLVLPSGMTETDARLIMGQAVPESTGDRRWVDYGDEFWGPDPVPPSGRAWRPFSQ